MLQENTRFEIRPFALLPTNLSTLYFPIFIFCIRIFKNHFLQKSNHDLIMYLEPHIGEYPGARKVEKSDIWDKVFKSGPSKICGRQP